MVRAVGIWQKLLAATVVEEISKLDAALRGLTVSDCTTMTSDVSLHQKEKT
jgi:hypothetical protein